MPLTPRFRANHGIDLNGVVGFHHTQLQFMGRRGGVARVNGCAIEQLIAPDTRVRKGPRDWAAYPTWIVPDDELTQCRQPHSRAIRVIPAAPDNHPEICIVDHVADHGPSKRGSQAH
jgi:hypothetical protein